MHAVHETQTRHHAAKLSMLSAEFAGQMATAVWLGKLSDDAAREALWSYALACHRGKRWESKSMLETLVAEYRRRRAGQDTCG